MVQIIVNEDEHLNNQMVEQLDEIKEEINKLNGSYNVEELEVIKGDIENIFNILDNQYSLFNEKFDVLNSKLEKMLNQKGAELKKQGPAQVRQNSSGVGKKRKSNSELFEPADYSKGLWKKLQLMDDGKIIDKTRSVYRLPIDVYDLLYIIECNDCGLTHGEFKKLYKDFGSNNNTMGKIVYNIREHNFDDIVYKYYESIKKVKFSIEDDFLKINGHLTDVSKRKANEWIQLMFNTTKKQKTIMDIIKSNKSFSKDLVHLVCDNYDNNELLSIIKPDEKELFIENNPSRRRNLIRNGGIL